MPPAREQARSVEDVKKLGCFACGGPHFKKNKKTGWICKGPRASQPEAPKLVNPPPVQARPIIPGLSFAIAAGGQSSEHKDGACCCCAHVKELVLLVKRMLSLEGKDISSLLQSSSFSALSESALLPAPLLPNSVASCAAIPDDQLIKSKTFSPSPSPEASSSASSSSAPLQLIPVASDAAKSQNKTEGKRDTKSLGSSSSSAPLQLNPVANGGNKAKGQEEADTATDMKDEEEADVGSGADSPISQEQSIMSSPQRKRQRSPSVARSSSPTSKSNAPFFIQHSGGASFEIGQASSEEQQQLSKRARKRRRQQEKARNAILLCEAMANY